MFKIQGRILSFCRWTSSPSSSESHADLEADYRGLRHIECVCLSVHSSHNFTLRSIPLSYTCSVQLQGEGKCFWLQIIEFAASTAQNILKSSFFLVRFPPLPSCLVNSYTTFQNPSEVPLPLGSPSGQSFYLFIYSSLCLCLLHATYPHGSEQDPPLAVDIYLPLLSPSSTPVTTSTTCNYCNYSLHLVRLIYL